MRHGGERSIEASYQERHLTQKLLPHNPSSMKSEQVQAKHRERQDSDGSVGEVDTPKAAAASVLSLDTLEKLIEISNAREKIKVSVRGKECVIEIWPLKGEDQINADSYIQIDPPLLPPAKAGMPQEYDTNDSKYIERLVEGRRKRNIVLIEGGTHLKFEGKSVEEKVTKAYAQLSRGVIEFLAAQIDRVSLSEAMVISKGNFTSGADSLPS